MSSPIGAIAFSNPFNNWRLPNDWKKRLEKWKEVDPKLYNWFVSYVGNPRRVPYSDKRVMYKMLRSLGHPRNYAIPAPRELKDYMKGNKGQVVQRVVNSCQEMEEMIVKLKHLLQENIQRVEELQRENQELRKGLPSLPERDDEEEWGLEPVPPPVPDYDEEEVERVMETNRQDREELLQTIPDAPPPPAPYRFEETKKRPVTMRSRPESPLPAPPTNDLFGMITNRRAAIKGESDEEENDDWDDTDCLICGEYAPFTCSSCRSVRYCGQECQRIDWNLHNCQ